MSRSYGEREKKYFIYIDLFKAARCDFASVVISVRNIKLQVALYLDLCGLNMMCQIFTVK